MPWKGLPAYSDRSSSIAFSAELEGLPAPEVVLGVVGSGSEVGDAVVVDGPTVGELVTDELSTDALGAEELRPGGPAVDRVFDAEVGRSGAIP